MNWSKAMEFDQAFEGIQALAWLEIKSIYLEVETLILCLAIYGR
jgi:hypothetical protein